MKIRTPLNDVKDQLISFISEGYGIMGEAFSNPYNSNIPTMRRAWEIKVVNYLNSVFPTKKESGQFQYTPGTARHFSDNPSINDTLNMTNIKLKVLEHILDILERYYQFEPESTRLYIQAIDSFDRVRGVNADQVQSFLNDGFLDIAESKIKEAFLEIIGQSYVPRDWGGETEDIYTSRILLNGERVQTSIILKGKGTIRGRETRLGDLGTNGDQLERMMRSSSSKLYIIQSVKQIAQDVINAAEAFITQHRTRGNHCYYCTIDGQDTAMLLFAYGHLRENASSTP